MTLSEKQQYSEQFEDIIYRLAYLMLDTMKITLNNKIIIKRNRTFWNRSKKFFRQISV